MYELEILGIDMYHILAWLFLYSFLGWVWESSYVSIKQKKLVNRGFVMGPVCTIYGVGAVSVYVILRPLEGNWAALYFGGVILATVLEYITAVIMERLFHASWWDYSEKKFNFQGRICLGSSVAWGFFTIAMFLVLQPFVSWAVELVSRKAGEMILTVVMLLYAMDFGFSVATAKQLGRKLEQMEQAMADFVENLQKGRVFGTAAEALEAFEAYRRNFGRLNIRERMDRYQDMLFERMEKHGISEQKEMVQARLKVLRDKFTGLGFGNGWSSRRLLKAYPDLDIVRRTKKRLQMPERFRRKNNNR